MTHVSFSPDVACGESPQCDNDVQGLADAQFQSVFNLRATDDVANYSSRQEGVCARNAQLMYLNFPVTHESFDEFHISAFRTKLNLLAAPTYVHGSSFSTAAMYCLIDHALKHGWSSDRAMQLAVTLDLPCLDEASSEQLRAALEAD